MTRPTARVGFLALVYQIKEEIMSVKFTRRVVLGLITGGLIAFPIAAIVLRRKLPEIKSRIEEFREHYQDRCSFPKKFDAVPHASTPPDKVEKIIQTHKRYWENFTKLDGREIEFDFSNRYYIKGKLDKDAPWGMDVHVRMKFGYGLSIEGKNGKGEPIQLVFNLDGDVVGFKDKRADLSSLMLTFFDSAVAWPDTIITFCDIEEGVYLPQDLNLRSHEAYNKISTIKAYRNELLSSYTDNYYNQKTGMLEFNIQYYGPGYHDYTFTLPDGTIPPAITQLDYVEVNDIYLTSRVYVYVPSKEVAGEQIYKNYELVKR
jgi:hypothetical protein